MKKSIAIAAILAMPSASAGTGYYLVSTYPNEGQTTVDYKYWTAKAPGAPRVSSPEIGVGYNVNSRWFTELSAVYLRTGAFHTRYTKLEWQNDVMLTQGQYPFDLALHTNIARHDDRSRGDEIEFGPVFQTEVGRTQFNLNLFFERDVRVTRPTQTDMKYQWQVRYRWKPKLEFGMQGFGELGEWDDWLPRERQSHRAGPALFGTWDLAGGHAWKYEAAFLTGKNAGRHAKSWAMRLQYVF